MAPSFDRLVEEDFQDDDEEIDFSGSMAMNTSQLSANFYPDLQEQYEVRLEEGLDAFVVVDGLPAVPEERKSKLVKFLVRKLNAVGKTREDAILMPMNEKTGMSEGFFFQPSIQGCANIR
jgi:translation initiation factor 3 subunit B